MRGLGSCFFGEGCAAASDALDAFLPRLPTVSSKLSLAAAADLPGDSAAGLEP